MDPTQVRGFGFLSAVALLRPGVSLQQAASEMETITARLRQQYPDTNNRRFNRVVSLHTHLVGETGSMLLLLFGAVSFVLLIACANVANLLLGKCCFASKRDGDSHCAGRLAMAGDATTARRKARCWRSRAVELDCCWHCGAWL